MKNTTEEKVQMSEYNHALFQNMVSCLTSIWEINVPVNKAWIMYDRFKESVNGKEFNYIALLDRFTERFVGKDFLHYFMSKMSLDALRNMNKEIVFECPLVLGDDDVRRFRFTLTPGERVNGVLESVYFSSIDLKTEVASMVGEVKTPLDRINKAVNEMDANQNDVSVVSDNIKIIREELNILIGIYESLSK